MGSNNFNIKRRHFITTSATSLAGIFFSKTVDGITTLNQKNNLQNRKFRKKSSPDSLPELHVATDFYDDLYVYYNLSGKLYERSHIDSLMRYVSGLGATRIEWVFDTIWNIYDHYPGDLDLLEYAVRAAHANNLEFYAVIKPFEGSFDIIPLPHTFPRPEGVPLLESIRGLTPVLDPFLFENPELRFKRRPGDWNPPGKLSAIRLIKNNDKPTRIRPEHLSIHTSNTNNHLQPYNGPVNFRETVEWRPQFRNFGKSRVIHLEGLDIPADHRYIVVLCSLKNGEGDFTNARGKIIELVNEHGNIIPCTPCQGPVKYDPDRSFPPVWNEVTRYGRHPEIQNFLNRPDEVRKHFQNMYYFDNCESLTIPHTLDQLGWAGAARGKNEYLIGNLSPVYSKVHDYWLEKVRYCIARNVDGINFRLANHTRSHEKWEYGFNETAEQKISPPVNVADVAGRNGKTFTLFLRKAKQLLDQHNLGMGVHLNSNLLHPDDRGAPNRIPDNVDFEWRLWLNELADYAETRAIQNLLPWNRRRVIDTYASATREAGIPLVYQSIKGNRAFKSFNGPFPDLENEIDYVKNHPGIDAYLLYETASFTRINKNGELEGSPAIAKLIREKFSSR